MTIFHDGFAYLRLPSPSLLQLERRKKYRLTQARYDALWKLQAGCCAICSQPNPRNIDHDHETGKVRGLLCRKCNVGLGMFQDDEKRLESAKTYLAHPPAKNVRNFTNHKR